MSIGGNKIAQIQVMTITESRIGSGVPVWRTVQSLKGFLDLQSGDSKYTSFNAKIQESTHIFIADYVPLEESIHAEECRVVVDGQRYDVMLMDNPMGLNQHYEIYLKYTGGQQYGTGTI